MINTLLYIQKLEHMKIIEKWQLNQKINKLRLLLAFIHFRNSAFLTISHYTPPFTNVIEKYYESSDKKIIYNI